MATTAELVRVIRNQCGGERCITATNGMHSLMVVKDRLVSGRNITPTEFTALLEKAEAENKLIIDRVGNSASMACVRVADKPHCKRQEPSEGEADVPTGRAKDRRVRGTTYAQTAEGRDIPANLPNRMVGPVEVSSKHTEKALDIAYIGLFDYGQAVIDEPQACEVIKIALGGSMDEEMIPATMPRELLRQLSCKGGKIIAEGTGGKTLYRIPELIEAQQQKEPAVVEKLTGDPTSNELLDKALKRIEELRGEADELRSRTPQCAHGDLEEKLRLATEAGLRFKRQVEELEGQRRTLTGRIEERQAELEQLKARISDMTQTARGNETTITGLRNKATEAATAHEQREKQLQDEIQDLRGQLEEAEKTTDELNAKLKGGGGVSADTLARFNELMGD